MDKYSEAVKEAQEKLELAEKKATDVSGRPGGAATFQGPAGGQAEGVGLVCITCLPCLDRPGARSGPWQAFDSAAGERGGGAPGAAEREPGGGGRWRGGLARDSKERQLSRPPHPFRIEGGRRTRAAGPRRAFDTL